MAATTIDINTHRKYVERLVGDDAKIAASTTIPLGAIVCFNAAGDFVNGADVAGLTIAGRAPRRMVNSTGAAAKLTPAGAYAEAGVFRWKTSGANAVTAADLGKLVYVLDNQTVVKIAGTAAGAGAVPAGILDSIDPDDATFVWVKTANC